MYCVRVIVGEMHMQSDRMRPNFTGICFVTGSIFLTVKCMSVRWTILSKRHRFFVTQSTFEADLMMPEGWKGMHLMISTAVNDNYTIHSVKNDNPDISNRWDHNLEFSCCTNCWLLLVIFAWDLLLLHVKIYQSECNGVMDLFQFWIHSSMLHLG